MFEKKETPQQVVTRAALLEAPVILAGLLAYLFTGNWIWVPLAVVVGAAIILPAIFKANRLQREQDDASR